MTKTMAVSPMPTTPLDALAHLVTHHGWDPRAAEATMVQAHRYAHGCDARPDLADTNLDHAHTTASWPAPTSPAPAKKSHKGAWMIGIGLLALIGFAAGQETGVRTRIGGSGTVGASTHRVTYKVEGTTTQASITYQNATGDTSQQSDIDVPMTTNAGRGSGITLNGMHRGDFLYISAQNSNEYGSVTCAIEVDGVRVKENTSRGGYTIATCSGRL